MTKLVYIGGYGHSGSTLLEYFLTACQDVIACGEVVNAKRERSRTRKCSCGKIAERCPVWERVFNLSSGSRNLSHQDLVLALINQVSQRHTLLIDSSKTAWRHVATPFRIWHTLDHRFILVHIVRDPRAVNWSLLRRCERLGLQFNKTQICLLTSLGWCLANLACELFRWRAPKNYRLIKYEDLARSPREELTHLLRYLAPERDCELNAIGSSDNRHQLYGNRMRCQQLSLTDIKDDDVWRTHMPVRYRRMVTCLTWWLGRRYGYWD